MARISVENAFTQLTAAGSTAAFNVTTNIDHMFAVTIAAIDTSVDVRAEGTNDGTNWFNLDSTGANTQYTANGTYLLEKKNFRCRAVRFTFVSEAGGAAATIDVRYSGGQ